MNAPCPIEIAEREPWRVLFDQALEAAKGNRQELANVLGVSRTTVSLVAANKYPGKLHAFAKRVMDAFDRYECPHLVASVTRAQCHTHADREAPTSSPREMRHWRACQTCPRNPSRRTEA